MFARLPLCASLLLPAACAGGRAIHAGDGLQTILILGPYSLARELETFVRAQKVRSVIDLRRRLKDPDVTGAWESLEPWEQQLWRDYAARGRGSMDSKRTDFHITREDRLLMALDLSLDYMGPGAREEGQRLLRDPAFVGGLALGVGLYVGLWLYPEPTFTKGLASIITAALLLHFSAAEIREFAWAWNVLEKGSAHARTLAELDQAGAKFGKAVGARGLHVLMVIFGKLAGRAAEGLSLSVGGTGPPAAVAAGAGLLLAEGQEIWVLRGGVIALAGPGALAVAMNVGGNVDLDQHEDSGGHLVKKHVEKTEADLRARLAAEPQRKVVSTLVSRAEAETAISAALRARATELTSWLERGAHDDLVLVQPFNGGMVLRRGAAGCVAGASIRVVLRSNGAGRWYVLTAYPLP